MTTSDKEKIRNAERKAYKKDWYEKNKTQCLAKMKRRRLLHEEEYHAYRKKYHQEHKEKENARSRDYSKSYPRKVNKNTGKSNYERIKLSQQKTRLLALSHYSVGGEPKCAHCGISDTEVLDIDHINDAKGAANHKQIGHGYIFARWLEKNHWPSGFQVLCRNCNWKKHLQYLRQKKARLNQEEVLQNVY